MSNCELLKEIKRQILAGIPAEEAIPYDIHCANESDYYDVLYYASQVLPDGRRKTFILNRLEEMDNAARSEISGQ